MGRPAGLASKRPGFRRAEPIAAAPWETERAESALCQLRACRVHRLSVCESDRRIGLPSKPAGTLYRGREGMWSWVAHRITGVGIFFFLLVHVLDTALVRVSPEAYNEVIGTYKNPIVGLLEVGLVGAILFHAFNGIRLILVDFWARGPRYQRQLMIGVGVVWIVLFVPFVIRHLSHVFGG
ncbi:succinate dehydrogenase subunit C [Kribbella steppae]|uniref:Succinate dehydrogenase subunit C n=1 Tax=Kribbella steppae TaxID=2512223 RepID=A0A4R2HR95_9ACTN|nr:succinate dehydrogenase subunit C [Kribbella steppae]